MLKKLQQAVEGALSARTVIGVLNIGHGSSARECPWCEVEQIVKRGAHVMH